MAQPSSSSSEVPQARARYVQAAAASAGVQFNEEMRWLCRVREALEHASAESLGAFPKVFDVPRALRDTKPDAYAPQHFALGPYHQSRPDLKDMERYKLAAAKRAERLFAGDHKIPDLVYRFLTLQGEIRGPYHRILELSNETLAWMMAVDTCFLLDFLLGRYQQDEVATDTNQIPLVLFFRNLELRYASEQAAADVLRAVLDRFIKDVCPIKTYASTAVPDFTKQAHLLELLYHFLVPTTAVFDDNSGQDIPPPALEHDQADDGGDLEKQIPAEYDKVKRACLQVSSMRFVKENLISRPKNLSGQLVRKMPPALSGLLPVVGKMIASVDMKARLKDVNMGTNIVDSPLAQEIKIPSVTQLAGCGVRFLPSPEGIAGVAFDEKTATLSLPVIVLDSNTEVVLRNLMAYEAVAVQGPLVLARYTELMNGIVDTAKDVKILQQSGVVVNRMKNKAEAASMWNGMCRATRVSRVPRLDAVIKAVNAHRDKTASARAQKLLKKYVFGSWKILTLLASVSLLLMTALQTFCSTYPCQSTWFGHILPSS
ncbi:unnamed protein product [Miscanthus lutarioriparius]|uniref:Uncharacterized protein n=1 Tax=Miscanthus lutarioriparius TaxID=422564 RepID=A0A811SNT6_9POAL|nr:unnamed protein product [Miscanthus lutarioriparius]